MKHKGVRIVVRINGLDMIDVTSLHAHHQAQLEGGATHFTYTPVQKLASTFELITTAIEEEEEEDDDETMSCGCTDGGHEPDCPENPIFV